MKDVFVLGAIDAGDSSLHCKTSPGKLAGNKIIIITPCDRGKNISMPDSGVLLIFHVATVAFDEQDLCGQLLCQLFRTSDLFSITATPCFFFTRLRAK